MLDGDLAMEAALSWDGSSVPGTTVAVCARATGVVDGGATSEGNAVSGSLSLVVFGEAR